MSDPASGTTQTPPPADAPVNDAVTQEAPSDKTGEGQRATTGDSAQDGPKAATSSYFKPPAGISIGPDADFDEPAQEHDDHGNGGDETTAGNTGVQADDSHDDVDHGDAHGDAGNGVHDDAVRESDEHIHSDENDEHKNDDHDHSFLQRDSRLETTSGAMHWLKPQELASLPSNIVSSIMDRMKYSGERAANAAPPRWTFPPAYSTGCETFVAAVPATAEAIQAGGCYLDGNGGTDVLVHFDDFSVEDLVDLDEILGPGARDRILRTALWRPSQDAVESALNRLQTRREFAAILAHFSPQKLAERTFNMISSMRQMLAKYRRMRILVDKKVPESQAVQAALDAQEESDHIKGEWRHMCEYWSHRIEDLNKFVDELREEHAQDIRRLAHNHFLEVEQLKQKIRVLKRGLQDVKYENNKLRVGDHLPDRRFKAWNFMDFLMDHAEVFPNWERLLLLCKHYEHGTIPDPSLKTRCMVDALDDLNAPRKDYPSKEERGSQDEDPKGDPGANAPGSGNSIVVDVTGDDSGDKFADSEKTHRVELGRRYKSRGASSSKKCPPANIQARPSAHSPAQDYEVLLPGDARRVSKADARKSLGPIVWKELRPDVREAMRSRLTYRGALNWLSEDRPAHSLFIESALVDMLVSMMFWNQLDETPWTKYVQDCYFQVAEARLEMLRSDGVIPPEWGPLEQGGVIYPFGPESESSEDEDDTDKDPSYDPNQEVDDGKDVDEDEHPVPENQATPDQDDENSDEDTTSKKNKRLIRGGSKQPSPSKKPRTRSSKSPVRQAMTPLREKSPLARIEYEKLTLAQLRVQEVPEPGVSSWRHFGALMQYASSSANAKEQTPGFPKYETHRLEMTPLHNRWSSQAYRDLEGKEPWQEMFKSRVQEMHFHKRADLSKRVRSGLDRYVGFMRTHQQAFWEAQHWVPIDKDADDDSAAIQEERRARRESLRNSHKALIKKLTKIPDFPGSLFHEPGLWTLPAKCCYWIWHDGQIVVKFKGEDHSLSAQLEEIDWAEPSRTQWATRSNDEQFLKYVPAELRARHFPTEVRAKNPVTLLA